MAENLYRTIAITVPAADSARLPINGTYLRCLESDRDFELQIDESSKGTWSRGIGFQSDKEFSSFRVIAPAGSSVTLTMAVGFGRIDDDRPIASNVGGSLSTVIDVAVATATSALILAANSARLKALIQNLHPSAEVRVGDSNVAAARGIRLGPGDLLEVETGGAVHVRNDSGVSVDIAAAEVTT